MAFGSGRSKFKSIFAQEKNADEMIREMKRYRTFTKWPFKSNTRCTPDVMASAGWYCTSEDHDDPSAKCVFCLKELSGWDPTDDPWEEHRKHSGECPFIKLNKTEKDFSIEETKQLIIARNLKLAEKDYLEQLKKLEEEKENMITFLEERLKIQQKIVN